MPAPSTLSCSLHGWRSPDADRVWRLPRWIRLGPGTKAKSRARWQPGRGADGGPCFARPGFANASLPSAEREEEEQRLMRYPQTTSQGTEDPVRAVRNVAQSVLMPAPIATFAGMNSVQSGCGCLPPDTHGDVGPNHYIQSVNSSIKIFDKTGTRAQRRQRHDLQFLLCRPGSADALRPEPKRWRWICSLRSSG